MQDGALTTASTIESELAPELPSELPPELTPLRFKCFRGRFGVRYMGGALDARPRVNYPKHYEGKGRTMEAGPAPRTLRGITSRTLVQRHVAFHGACYLCQYASHSQMFCPLRWCRACKRFGHSEAVCARIVGPAAMRRAGAGGGTDADDDWEEALAEWD